MIRMFVGHDPREAVAYHVFVASAVRFSSMPIQTTALALNNLADVYTEAHTDGSNDFIYSRFLVPWLCGFEGWAIFADGDMLCRYDLAELWNMRDETKAVQVIKHDYKTKHPVKYLGAKNEDYPRKNWSSVILWNCAHPQNRCLLPNLVAQWDGAYLHRFGWLAEQEIGWLPFEWNWLAMEYPYNKDAKLVHFTVGTPCFKGYDECDYAVEWHSELERILRTPSPGPTYLSNLENL